MRPLRTILFVSLIVALAISIAFGFALARVGFTTFAAVALGVIAFLAFFVPACAAFAWTLRRAADLAELSRRTRRVADGDYDAVIADRPFHGELNELARLSEDLRELLVMEQAAFDEYRRTIQQIVDALGDGLLALNHRGQIAFANARVAHMFGYSNLIPGRSYLEVVRKQPLIAAFDLALSGQGSVERTTIGSGGNERQVEIRVFPVASSGEIAAVALFIDVTQIERLQRVRKDFLDDFSHEVRTPLAGIRSAAETLANPLTAQEEEQLRAVLLRQVGRMERLVDGLSELNSIESGVIVLERRDVDLLDMATDLCEEFTGRFAGQSVSVSVTGSHVLAWADPARVQQILSNLMDNACKYGGAESEVLVDVSAERNEAIVRVSDEGEGIPPAEAERIFNRFYRVDRSRSQSVPGIGLGLAIAKHLVAAHGGTIRAFNRPDRDKGATFEFRLPLSAAARRVG